MPPDLNILDLGFLQSLQYRQICFTSVELRTAVENVFSGKDTLTTDKIFLTLQAVHQRIVLAIRANEHKLPRVGAVKVLKADSRFPHSLKWIINASKTVTLSLPRICNIKCICETKSMLRKGLDYVHSVFDELIEDRRNWKGHGKHVVWFNAVLHKMQKAQNPYFWEAIRERDDQIKETLLV